MSEINPKFYPAIGRIFSPIVMESLMQYRYSPYLSEIFRNSGLNNIIDPKITLGQFLDSVYSLLFKNYRNEYIYKNVVTNKILLGKHSLNTSKILTEFRVGNNKADVVLLNGSSTVYEIKSEYDSFDRLENQISSYFKVFDFINLISTPKQAEKLFSLLPEGAGILVLTDRETITTLRKPKSNIQNLNQDFLFDSLRKNEYTNIIKDYYGIIPNVPNTMIYRECKTQFCKISPCKAHDLTIKYLKKRAKSKVLKEFVGQAPSSVSAYAMSISGQKNKLKKLMALFDMNLSSILIPNAI